MPAGRAPGQAMAGAAAAGAYSGLHGAGVDVIPAALLSGVAYYAVNIPLVAVVIWLARGTSPAANFREQLAWLLPHYAAFGALAGLFVEAWHRTGFSVFLLFGLPTLVLWVAQQQYVERSRTGVDELRRSHAELEQANAELRQEVAERRRAEDALLASNAVKDEFLGLVSHELRTPVTTIFGNARLLRDRGDRIREPDRDSMIADIAEDSERLLGIIENLLLLTRLGTGPNIDLEPQVLAHVVRKSTDSFRRRHPGRVVSLHSEPRHIIVEADRTYLELVMENLLSNADKYSPAHVEIDVVIRVDGTEARVSVLDRGIGIGEADAEKLFTPFYRTDAAKSHANGIGIGLAVCKRVIESQGGRIWARPRVGGGSELAFALPLATDFGDSPD
jgi:signal transduction histidine kinase